MQYIPRQRSPASSLCKQLCTLIPLWRQFTSLVSLPLQITLSRCMGPVPWPKKARKSACAPVEIDKISQDYIIATITSRLDWLQPFHMKIDKTCNQCLASGHTKLFSCFWSYKSRKNEQATRLSFSSITTPQVERK